MFKVRGKFVVTSCYITQRLKTSWGLYFQALRNIIAPAAPKVEIFQLTKEEQPLLSLFHDGVNASVSLQVLRDGGSQQPE